jgi:hypothetical protein
VYETSGQVSSERQRQKSGVMNASRAVQQRQNIIRIFANSYGALFVNMPGDAGDYRYGMTARIFEMAECFFHNLFPSARWLTI